MKRRSIASVMLGTLIEYYDYSLYGFSAAVIASHLLPSGGADDPLLGLLYAYAIYSVSYFSKPLGSLIFGRIGDRYGRRAALSITIIGISLPTSLIGLTPSYESIGIYSILMLILCRFLQGFFTAGEYDGAAIYVMEHMGSKWRYTASAVTRFMGVLGLVTGIASVNFFNSHILPDWGWRVPFLLSFPLGIIALLHRKNVSETPEFKAAQYKNWLPTKTLIKTNIKLISLMILMSGSFGITYQIAIIFMKQYLVIILPKSEMVVKSVSIIWVLAFGVSMPVSGLLADYWRPSAVMKCSAILTIFAVVGLVAASMVESINLAIASCITLAAVVAPFNGLAHGLMLGSVNVESRYRAISMGHSIGSMLLSGTAQFFCLKVIKNTGMQFFPLFYLVFFAVIASIVAGKLEKKRIS